MEIVNENEETAPQQRNSLEEERSRMLSNVQKTSQSMTPAPSSSSPDGPRMPTRKSSVMRTNSLSRGGGGGPPLRSNSMRGGVTPVRPMAPTKSSDCMSSMRGSSLQRANSSRLQRTSSSRGKMLRSVSSRGPPARSMSSRGVAATPGRRAPPSRTSSVDSTNSLRAYRRDVLSNTGIEAKDMIMTQGQRIPGPGATLERHTSGDMSVITAGDLSCFTMDSVNLRKTQLVADPIEDGTYNEMDSCADHESISRASCFSEYAPPQKANATTPQRLGVYRTPSRMGAIKFDKLQISSSVSPNNSNNHDSDGDDDDDDDQSFGTMTSGLTTDFTEHEELMDSDNEDDDDLIEED